MNKCKAILFDFNGTMIFDSDIHRNVWFEFFKKYENLNVTRDEIKNKVLGRDNASILKAYIGEHLSEKELEDLTFLKEATYREVCKTDKQRFSLVPGVEDFLDYLVEKKIPFTIATGSEIHNVRFYFSELKLDRWFDFNKVVYDDGTFPGKPAPDIYLKAAKLLGYDISDCLVFEDAIAGVKAARSAGAGRIIAVSEKDNLEFYNVAGGVDYAANNFINMKEIIGKL